MKARKLLFSVTMKDLEMQTFIISGNGGGGKDTSRNGVRLIHEPSGARGEGKSQRSLTQNRREAFLHLIETDKFKRWHKAKTATCMGAIQPESEESMFKRVDKMIVDGLVNGEIMVEVY